MYLGSSEAHTKCYPKSIIETGLDITVVGYSQINCLWIKLLCFYKHTLYMYAVGISIVIWFFTVTYKNVLKCTMVYTCIITNQVYFGLHWHLNIIHVRISNIVWLMYRYLIHLHCISLSYVTENTVAGLVHPQPITYFLVN